MSSIGVRPASRGVYDYLAEVPTIPNCVTGLRLAMTIAIVWLTAHVQAAWIPWDKSLTIAVLATVAAASDGIDGWLARKFGWVTTVGKHLDQVTDYILGAGLIYAIQFPLEKLQWFHVVIGTVILTYALTVGILRLLRLTSDSSIMAKRLAGWQMGAGCGILGSYALGWDILSYLGYTILAVSMFVTVFCFKGYWQEARQSLGVK